MPGRTGEPCSRRAFIKRLAAVGLGSKTGVCSLSSAGGTQGPVLPNVLFVFADQWRAQATGYNGDPNARTPRLDEFAGRSVRFAQAVSNCPVCSPYRASLLTGQYPLTHGVFINDVPLSENAQSIGKIFAEAGYATGWIGKWHLDGHGSRSAFIPRIRRQGFRFWKAQECTHNYNHSFYWDDDVRRQWKGYDAQAQTEAAEAFIRRCAGKRPFLLFLSWGPPHAPYHTAPGKYRARFPPEKIALRPNVPVDLRGRARKDLAGYYAHIAALDDCFGRLLDTLENCGIAEDTLVVFTSDHGDMLGSQGAYKKQRPWEESIRVPFLLRWPRRLGRRGRVIPMRLSSPDIFPTLCGLCGLPVPQSVEGQDLSPFITGARRPVDNAALIMCPAPFGQWSRRRGGKEFRGVRTARYTYVRDLHGPWLLYDNEADPYQLNNLCDRPEAAGLRRRLDDLLVHLLERTGDEFLPGPAYIARWGWRVNAGGTAPYRP